MHKTIQTQKSEVYYDFANSTNLLHSICVWILHKLPGEGSMLARLFRVQQQLTGGQNHENKTQDHVFFNSISIASVFWISPLTYWQCKNWKKICTGFI